MSSGAYEGSFNGWAFGDGARPGASVRSLVGFGSTSGRPVVTESTNGGGHIGSVVKGAKQVRLGFNLHASSPAGLKTLRDEIDYRFDVGSQELPLTIDGRLMYVVPVDIDHSKDPSWPGPEKTAPCDIIFQVGDPGVYSPETDIPFGGGGSPVAFADLEFENLGRRTTRHWRAWRLRITAHGTVTNPYVRIAATGQIVTWAGLTMTGGQVLEVGAFRASRIGSLRVDSYRRSGASEFPNWPVLQPGENTVRVGCATGLVSGNLFARSTYG